MEDVVDSEVEKVDELPQDPIWAKHAEAWEYITPPLRPCREDIDIYQRRAFALLAGIGQPRVLMLGCTPELLLMEWPPDTRIVCVEQSTAMAHKVYEPARIYVDEYVHTRLRIGNWLRLSDYFPTGTFDLVIGDGCYTQLTAEQYTELGQQIEAVAAPGCVFLHRFFVSPTYSPLDTVAHATVSPTDVLEQLKVPYLLNSFSAVKLELMVALQSSFYSGVCLGDVYDEWAKFMDRNPMVALKPQHYLSRERATIEHYRGSNKRYTFPKATLSEIGRAVAPLTLAEFQTPRYPLWQYCRHALMMVQKPHSDRRPSVLESSPSESEDSP